MNISEHSSTPFNSGLNLSRTTHPHVRLQFFNYRNSINEHGNMENIKFRSKFPQPANHSTSGIFPSLLNMPVIVIYFLCLSNGYSPPWSNKLGGVQPIVSETKLIQANTNYSRKCKLQRLLFTHQDS